MISKGDLSIWQQQVKQAAKLMTKCLVATRLVIQVKNPPLKKWQQTKLLVVAMLNKVKLKTKRVMKHPLKTIHLVKTILVARVTMMKMQKLMQKAQQTLLPMIIAVQKALAKWNSVQIYLKYILYTTIKSDEIKNFVAF